MAALLYDFATRADHRALVKKEVPTGSWFRGLDNSTFWSLRC